METLPDPFHVPRKEAGVLKCEFQGESVPMILRGEDAWCVMKDWKRFSSGEPFRVPVPPEEDLRTMLRLAEG